MTESLQGQLLIASPDLLAPDFHQAVVLVVEHNDEGAMGLVLNRPSDTTIDEILAEARGRSFARRDPVHVGGPCEGPLMAVHDAPELADREVAPALHFSVETEQIEALADREALRVRFFAGHAGWAPGQLEEERAAGAWHVAASDPADVYDPPEELWGTLRGWLERVEALPHVPERAVPRDPTHN